MKSMNECMLTDDRLESVNGGSRYDPPKLNADSLPYEPQKCNERSSTPTLDSLDCSKGGSNRKRLS